MNEKAIILAVDDDAASMALLIRILIQAGYQVRSADSGELALSAVAAKPPDLILLDVRMQGLNGLEVCRRLKANEQTRQIPIILISAFADAKDWVEGLQLGAADYITKPYQPQELLVRVKTHLAIKQVSASLQQQTIALQQTNEQLQSEIIERRRVEELLHRNLDQSERSRRVMLSTLEDKKRTEEELRESSDYLEKLLRYANAPIIVWDPNLLILRFNMAFERLTGYTAEEVIGKNLSLLFPPSSRSESMTQIERSRGGESWEIVEIPIQCKDGSIRVVLWNSANIYAEDGVTLQATIAQGTDVTERKQLEEQIRQVRSDIFAAVSHDLKSPLQTLLQTQEMLAKLPSTEAWTRFQDYSEIWRRNLQRLERMINNLVDSQRGEEDRFPLLLAPCNPVEMVNRVVEDSQGYALSSQVTFNLNLQQVPEGSCDREAIARVVENLLTNAVKFSPKGGQVEIRLGIEGDALFLEVEDHGVGIPAEEQAQLFQPFQRGRSAQQKGIPGTGLGLYVCRRIVEEHGGTITLTSEEGKGTKVTVRLPWGVAKGFHPWLEPTHGAV